MEMIGTLDEPEPLINAGAFMVRECINEGKTTYAFTATVAELKAVRRHATAYAEGRDCAVHIHMVERGRSGPPYVHRYNLVVSPAKPPKGQSND